MARVSFFDNLSIIKWKEMSGKNTAADIAARVIWFKKSKYPVTPVTVIISTYVHVHKISNFSFTNTL